MIRVSIEELLDFYKTKPGDYAAAVRLEDLRALHGLMVGYKAECERLAAELVAAKAAK